MDKIKAWHIIMVVIAMVFAGFFFCDGRWNEDKAIAEVKFTAASNKEMYLKMTLDQICQRYGFNAYPCPIGRMTEQDKINYKQYEEWYKAERQRIRRMFGG
jgi:hypothetical protein